jgi:hypothetical protein
MEAAEPLPAIFLPTQEYLYQRRLERKNEKRRAKAAEQRAKKQEEKDERRRKKEEEKEAREQEKRKRKQQRELANAAAQRSKAEEKARVMKDRHTQRRLQESEQLLRTANCQLHVAKQQLCAAEERWRRHEQEQERQKIQEIEREKSERAKRKAEWRAHKRKAAQPAPPMTAPQTRVRVRDQPRHHWVLIELRQVASFLPLLACPFCTRLSLQCLQWKEANGSFSVTVHCSQQDCSFTTLFSSTSRLASNYRRRDGPTRLAIAWGVHALGFERLESVFALSGGVPLLNKASYAELMHNLVSILPETVI